MSQKIAIVDYEMGNLRSVQKAFEKIGINAFITSKPSDLDSADKIVLPGVGAFQDAMDELNKKALIDPIIKSIKSGKLFLGICLGLQLLFDKSFEDGEHDGLGLISGEVVKFKNNDEFINNNNSGENRLNTKLKIPHMGWNRVCFTRDDIPIFRNIPDKSYMYFVHSYYICPKDVNIVIGLTDYGIDFPSVIAKDNIFAMQFHPEKSQKTGLDLLKNFGELK